MAGIIMNGFIIPQRMKKEWLQQDIEKTSAIIRLDDSNSFEASTLRTVSSEHHRVLQNTPIFSNLHKLGC
jgi:hypothetical protein